MGTEAHDNICGQGLNDIVIHESCQEATDICPDCTATSDPELLERIVRHCAPTLAGLKCGSMFKIGSRSHGITRSLRNVQAGVKSLGVRMMVLHRDDAGDLVLVYRQSLLAKRLRDPEVREFLHGYGYGVLSVNSALSELRTRFTVCPMPPEVGVFLDYPMEDIKGYIKHEGRCSHCIGCWKVYGNVDEAKKRFELYRQCRDDYCNRLSMGCSITHLIVPV